MLFAPNSGTAAEDSSVAHARQSERFYGALKGQGVACKLVILPHESHGYVAYESIMHTLYEQDAWLERYVKNRPSTGGNGNGSSTDNGSTNGSSA